MAVNLNVNGSAHEIDVDPATPLLYVLRDHLALNGAKYGCGLGQCGSCTVMVDGRAVFSSLRGTAGMAFSLLCGVAERFRNGLGILLMYHATPSAMARPRTSPMRIPTSKEWPPPRRPPALDSFRL